MSSTEFPSAVLSLKSVVKNFSSQHETVSVLNGVNWNLERGVSAAIVGESGAGKSTLLHLAAALDRPSEGQVWVDGTDLGPLKEREVSAFRASKVGIIFQFHFLLKEFTVWENVWLPAWLAGVPKKAAKERARE
ncbi:MAG: ATP-binding cassette domain-containing protein, partial [Spirochaetales bacterium]|nr:ATP-binding cassette domain-containing protein [Spirochaetales bacterium]